MGGTFLGFFSSMLLSGIPQMLALCRIGYFPKKEPSDTLKDPGTVRELQPWEAERLLRLLLDLSMNLTACKLKQAPPPGEGEQNWSSPSQKTTLNLHHWLLSLHPWEGTLSEASRSPAQTLSLACQHLSGPRRGAGVHERSFCICCGQDREFLDFS